MQDIHKGNHDDKGCDKYCNKYKDWLGQELPDCQFKGNKSEIRKLIRKVRIDANGSVDEVQSLDEEITSLMSSNMVQQVMNLGCDASLIQSTLEKQLLKYRQPFLDPNSLALAAYDTYIKESGAQPLSSEISKNPRQPSIEEIQTLMRSNMVQQVLNVGVDATLIELALERQIFKTGHSFLGPNSLALAALNLDIEESPSLGAAESNQPLPLKPLMSSEISKNPRQSLDDEIQTLMSSDMVRQVLSVGFEACLIKSTLELQILKNGKPFSDPNSLILAVLDTEGEERPSTHIITNLETEDATVSTSFDELTSCNSDLKESFEVAMTNPVDEVEHRRPESPEASRIKHRGPGYGKKSVIAKEQPEEIQCGEEQECANKNKGRCIVL